MSFGQPKPFGTSTFGNTPTFGSSSFASTQAGGSSLFGAKPTVSFGSTGTTGGGLFGSPSTAFGASTAAGAAGGSLFGGSSTFSTPTAGTLFGTPAQTKSSLFGTTQATPFGASTAGTSTGFTFGTGAAGGSLFGAQQQQQQATGGLFGSAAQPTAATGGLFGAAAPNGTTIKFNPKVDTDTMMKNNIQQNIQTKHQCVTAMKEYEAKCLEELRVEDYLANRKGPTAGQPGLFGSSMPQPQQQATGLFGTTATTVGSSLFGQNKPLFGGFGTATSSAAGPSLFGQSAAPQQQTGGLFGASTTKPLFGTATTTTSTFTFSTPASTGGLFGQQQAQPTLFGTTTTQPSLFGASAQQQPAAPLFGAQGAAPAFGQGQTMFGATSVAPTAGAFGGFGQTSVASPFGASTSLFGAKTATTTAPAFGGFGASTFGGTGFAGGFGATTQPSLFGGQQQQQQKPLFGGFGTQQPAFGATGATTGAGLFGASPFGATGGQTLFGAQQQAKPGLSFGAGTVFLGTGVPGVPDASQTASLGTDYNTTVLQHELLRSQLLGLSTSPYGDRKLGLKGKRTDEEPLPVPTDPLAQKRLMDMSRSSSAAVSGLRGAKPLPPFKPLTRLTVISPSQKTQPENVTALQGLDSDTISFTEGFIPKKNIKKLILKPKDRGDTHKSSQAGGGQQLRNVSFPEDRALTFMAQNESGIRSAVDRSTVMALNFDNTTDSVSEGCTKVRENTCVIGGGLLGRVDQSVSDVSYTEGGASRTEGTMPDVAGDEVNVMNLETDIDDINEPDEPAVELCPGLADKDVSIDDEVSLKSTPAAGALFSQFIHEIQQQGKPSLMDREMGGVFDNEWHDFSTDLYNQRTKRKPLLLDLHEKSLSMMGGTKVREESAMIDLSRDHAEVSPSPSSSLIAPGSDSLFVIRPRRDIRPVPYHKSTVATAARSLALLDSSLLNGRRFRAGWATGGVVVTRTSEDDQAKSGQKGSLFTAPLVSAGPHEFTLSLVNAAPSAYPPLQDLDCLLQCQFGQYDSTGGLGCGNRPVLQDGDKTITAYLEESASLKDPSIISPVFELCNALWGKVEGDTREEAVSLWIMRQSESEVDRKVDFYKRKGQSYYIEAVFTLLTSRRIEEASRLAQEGGDWRLSLIISQMVHSGPEIKALCLEQLKRWSEVQADRYIDTARLKIYALAAGILKWKTSDGRLVCAYENLDDWKRTLGLYLWYVCSPFSTISGALEQYEKDWISVNGNGASASRPSAHYISTEENCSGNTELPLDVSYHLLRLFSDPSYSIFSVLESAGWTADPLDFHLSWHLWCILQSYGVILVEPHRLDTLHAQYAFQLERGGVWQRGVFVALHVDDRNRREALVKQLLSRHSKNCSETDKHVLMDEFNIPQDWLA